MCLCEIKVNRVTDKETDALFTVVDVKTTPTILYFKLHFEQQSESYDLF